MNISTKLKELRYSKGYTALYVADFLGITRSAYSNYEQSIRQPDYDILIKLALLYNVSTDYLLGLENEDGSKTYQEQSFKREVDSSELYAKERFRLSIAEFYGKDKNDVRKDMLDLTIDELISTKFRKKRSKPTTNKKPPK